MAPWLAIHADGGRGAPCPIAAVDEFNWLIVRLLNSIRLFRIGLDQ